MSVKSSVKEGRFQNAIKEFFHWGKKPAEHVE
jgi:hypothetical protein